MDLRVHVCVMYGAMWVCVVCVLMCTALWGHGILETPHFQQWNLEVLCTQGRVVEGGAAASAPVVQFWVNEKSVAFAAPWSQTRVQSLHELQATETK